MVYYMFNKPPDCVTARTDERKKTVLDYFPKDIAERVHPVGRLDFDTHGLLFVTDDGMVDQALLLPERHATKKYFFYAIGKLDEEKIEKIESGVLLGQSGNTSRPAKITVLSQSTVKGISDYLPDFRKQRYLKNPSGDAFCAELEIHEGRKHQVKLMMRAVDCRVVYLKRTEMAGIKLDENLKEGEYRPLNKEELEIIVNLENQIRINKIDICDL